MTAGDLQALAARALEEIAEATDVDQLGLLRQRYLSRRGGSISQASQSLATAQGPEKASLGRAFNQAKGVVEEALTSRQATLETGLSEVVGAAPAVDLSYSGGPLERGHQHPIGRLIREIEEIAATLGYRSVRGPEAEDDHFNFELLNMPAEHPARDSHDTFYLAGRAEGLLLRTHTSPMQMRWMLSGPPPYRIIVPGKVYRRDNPDPTHNPMFHQVEGLCVDEGVTVGDLKGTLTYFLKSLFGSERRVRLRSSFFPYTEPSLEADVSCWFCQGAGCRSCHFKGWIEILGCGMVHPQVLLNAGVDPNRYSGFAFGMGPDRIAALKYGIRDIRDLYENDLRFLEGF